MGEVNPITYWDWVRVETAKDLFKPKPDYTVLELNRLASARLINLLMEGQDE